MRAAGDFGGGAMGSAVSALNSAAPGVSKKTAPAPEPAPAEPAPKVAKPTSSSTASSAAKAPPASADSKFSKSEGKGYKTFIDEDGIERKTSFFTMEVGRDAR